MLQLDFFEKDSKILALKEEVQAVRISSDKVRKGLFARHNELAKMYLDLNYRFEIIERNICNG